MELIGLYNENQLRRAVEMRRNRLIEHLKVLSLNDDDTPFEELTLSDLEREWKFYMENGTHHQAN